MSKPTLYLETTVIGHLTARPQSDVSVAARQVASHSWWAIRDRYSLFVSQTVHDECMAGDPIAASERMMFVGGIPLLEVTDEARILAKSLMDRYAIPKTETRDALHIALAATNGVQYLLTWNFRHIANAETRTLIEETCRIGGYTPPTICTPDELLGT